MVDKDAGCCSSASPKAAAHNAGRSGCCGGTGGDAVGKPAAKSGCGCGQTALTDTHAHHEHGQSAVSEPGTLYTCPMHPEIRQDKPGNCPICGMTLEPLMPLDTE